MIPLYRPSKAFSFVLKIKKVAASTDGRTKTNGRGEEKPNKKSRRHTKACELVRELTPRAAAHNEMIMKRHGKEALHLSLCVCVCVL